MFERIIWHEGKSIESCKWFYFSYETKKKKKLKLLIPYIEDFTFIEILDQPKTIKLSCDHKQPIIITL